MDDLLFIIISLIIGGIGVFGQMKKKKPLTESSPEEIDLDFFSGFRIKEEYLPEEGGSNYNPNSYSSATIETIAAKKTETVIFDEGISTINTKTENREIITKTETDYDKLKTWRKAVVYNEILNRKYL